MTPKQFIRLKLASLAKVFPDVQFSYSYNSFIETHVVEIIPAPDFTNVHKLDKAWIPVSVNFKQKFAAEDIVFIPQSSTLRITEPELIFNAAVIAQKSSSRVPAKNRTNIGT